MALSTEERDAIKGHLYVASSLITFFLGDIDRINAALVITEQHKALHHTNRLLQKEIVEVMRVYSEAADRERTAWEDDDGRA